VIGPFLVARLTADSVVGPMVGTNVFDTTAPQDVLPPFIVFEEFDGERYEQMGSDANICDARLRLHIWHTNVPDRDTLVTGVRQSLQRYSGTLAGIEVDDLFIIAGGPSFFDATLRAYHVVRDFRVIYRESGPEES